MLFASVAETVASQADLALVAGVALCTAIQVALGALFGLALSPLVDGQYSRDRKLFGWHPLQPAPSAEAIAAGTAAAIGVPAASAALLPRARPPPTGLRQMVALACTFGNSFTLPSVFFLTMLPPALSRPAISYAALFLLAWSPCIWSLGPAMLERGATPPPAPPPPPPPSAQQQRRQQQQQPAADAGGGDGEQAGEQPAAPRRHLAIFDQLVPHGAAQRLRRFAGQVVNPPFLAIVTGLAVGLTPLGRGLFAPGGAAAGSGAAAAAAALPPELSLARAAVKAAVEVVRLLAESATPIGTIVLASSLLQRPADGAAGAGAPPAVAPPPPARRRRGWLGAAAALLLPADGVEARALAVIALARFLLLPLATLSTMRLLGAAGLLPGGAAADPLLLLVLLVQAVMPSAQNLIVLLQLSPATQPLAPAFSRLLLKLYAYAALPVSLWVTGFCTGLAIPVVRARAVLTDVNRVQRRDGVDGRWRGGLFTHSPFCPAPHPYRSCRGMAHCAPACARSAAHVPAPSEAEPTLRLFQKHDGLVLLAELPEGVQEDDVDLSVEGRALRLRVLGPPRAVYARDPWTGAACVRRAPGALLLDRTLALSSVIDAGAISADLEADGVLTVRLPYCQQAPRPAARNCPPTGAARAPVAPASAPQPRRQQEQQEQQVLHASAAAAAQRSDGAGPLFAASEQQRRLRRQRRHAPVMPEAGQEQEQQQQCSSSEAGAGPAAPAGAAASVERLPPRAASPPTPRSPAASSDGSDGEYQDSIEDCPFWEEGEEVGRAGARQQSGAIALNAFLSSD
eukprot:scaffold2.g7237.t1